MSDFSIAVGAGVGQTAPVELHGNDYRDSQTTPLRTLYVGGSLNGATVAAQVSPDGGTTWFDVSGADTITAATVVNIEVRAGFLRLNITGGTSPSVNAWLR